MAPRKATPQTFVSAVAHELKNPLSTIFGYADLLLETHVGDGLTDTQREVVGRVRTTALKAVDLVQNYQFLALHQVTQTPSGQTTDLRRAFDAVFESYWRDSQKNLETKVTLPPGPLFVQGGANYLERIISNLLSNALKYTPVGGVVTITGIVDGTEAHFSVHNTGSYIPPEEISAIFEMYRRSTTAPEDRPSAGLGLFIVHTICEAIGATLTVASTQQAGTTFTVAFKIP